MDTGKCYDLSKFLIEIKKNPNKVILVENVEEDAKNQLNLYGKKAILDFITSIPMEKFHFVNSKEYRKGIAKNGTAGNLTKREYPMVDSYIIEFKFQTDYISFGFSKINEIWFIKSLHSDKDETLSIGAMTQFINNLI